MNEMAAASAVVLALVFGSSAVSKVRARESTVASFRGLRLPAPTVLSSAVPVVESVLAVGLVVAPAPAAYVALALLVAFSVVIGRAVAAGATVGCACFGGGGADERPVSVVELVRNAGLGALAVLATGVGDVSALWPSGPALVIVAALVALGWAALRAVARVVPRRQRRGDDGT